MASIRIEPLGRAELKFARFTVSEIHMHEVDLDDDEEDNDKPRASRRGKLRCLVRGTVS